MRPIPIFLIFCLLSLLVSYGIKDSFAESQSFQINAGQSQYTVIPLNQGDTIQFSISVVGGSGNDVDFTINDPNFNTLSNIRVGGSYNSEFTASLSGNYKFSFGNTFSVISSKQVQFSYDITAPSSNQISTNNAIVGLVFLIIIIVIPVVVGISTYKRRKKKSIMKTSLDERTPPKQNKELQKHNEKAMDILKNRLATGEINKEEFDKLRKEFE